MTTEKEAFICEMCGDTQEVHEHGKPYASICNYCWFSHLSGTERRAIAERVGYIDD